MKYTTPLFEVKSLYQRHLALAGDSQALTALDAAYIYRINTPIMHAYWLPRRKQHIKTKATLPPERPVWIEYSEPLPRTHMQKMRSKATGSGPKPLHQRVAAPIKQGDVLPDVAALWFWAVDLRWRLDLIDTQGQSTEYLYFYTPSVWTLHTRGTGFLSRS